MNGNKCILIPDFRSDFSESFIKIIDDGNGSIEYIYSILHYSHGLFSRLGNVLLNSYLFNIPTIFDSSHVDNIKKYFSHLLGEDFEVIDIEHTNLSDKDIRNAGLKDEAFKAHIILLKVPYKMKLNLKDKIEYVKCGSLNYNINVSIKVK